MDRDPQSVWDSDFVTFSHAMTKCLAESSSNEERSNLADSLQGCSPARLERRWEGRGWRWGGDGEGEAAAHNASIAGEQG